MRARRTCAHPAPPSITRRALLGCCALLLTSRASAEADGVPLTLQARLLSKVVKYDKNFAKRASGRVRISIVVNARSADSRYAANVLRRELDQLDSVGGLPFNVQLHELRDERALRKSVEAERISVVYVTPGLGERAAAIAQALKGADVLSVAVAPDDVASGMVLGFDPVSSQPKLLCNLASAMKQNVSFEPQALKLMKVFR
ncbi:MAG: YfiR family protein [Polyangiaceae bacterium]